MFVNYKVKAKKRWRTARCCPGVKAATTRLGAEVERVRRGASWCGWETLEEDDGKKS